MRSSKTLSELPPIPVSKIKDTTAYRRAPVDFNSPYSADPLVELPDYGIACDSYYARTDNTNAPYYGKITGATPRVMARKQVAIRLRKVNNLLRRRGVELLVLDGYRSLKCQQGLWDFFSERVGAANPSASKEYVEQQVLKY